MKVLKKINLFFHRIDGLFSLAVAILSFLSMMQCALGLQNGIDVLAVPCVVLLGLTVIMLSRFCDWLLFVDRRTRVKMVKIKVNTVLQTWGMENYEEKRNKE